MAVVKLRYIRSKSQIKKHLRYITHRRGEDGATITRPLFDNTGLTDKRAVYELIDAAARGTAFFKLMISPDPGKEDTRKDLDLARITRKTIGDLEKLLGRRLQFVATVHSADHTDKRHIHGFFLLQGRLSREKFRALRQVAYQTAGREARLQRKARDRIAENPRYRSLTRYHTFMRSLRRVRNVRKRTSSKLLSRSVQAVCTACGYGYMTGIPNYRIICPKCHARLKPNLSRRFRLALQR
jgi:predicted Zn-ribbon and HTH transcriptional regulator